MKALAIIVCEKSEIDADCKNDDYCLYCVRFIIWLCMPKWGIVIRKQYNQHLSTVKGFYGQNIK